MNKKLRDSLKKLDYVYGVSGDEVKVADALREEMAGLYDEHFADILGNQYYVKYGRERDKKIVLCAHMDEIGLAINYISEDGRASVVPVGFVDDRIFVNQKLVVNTEKGPVEAVTGMIPIHFLSQEEMQKPIKLSDVWLDFGTSTREETRELGVDIGDYATFKANGQFLNDGKVYCGKSLDDRAGCAVLVELFRKFQQEVPEVTVYAVGSVQEEVGMRAGGPIVNRINPDLFLSIDLTLARGIPGIEWNKCCTQMGKGIAIDYFDWDPELGMTGNNVPKWLARQFVEIAKRNNIPYQKVVLTGGGTDAWGAAYAGMGCLCGVILIPCENAHSAVSTVNMDDVESLIDFLYRVIKEIKI